MRGCAIAIIVFLVLVSIAGILVGIAVPNFFGHRPTVAGETYPDPALYGPINGGQTQRLFVHEGANYARLAALGAVLAVPLLLLILASAMLRGGGSSHERRRASESEAREIQDLHHGFDKLAERVEALETILMDKNP
ncbi:hypothetical protein JW916_12335 [Candidatus Sumerlaeota bacterium]|nr:hypothetical protein [Candidatus Sumerlaeota bacterium]